MIGTYDTGNVESARRNKTHTEQHGKLHFISLGNLRFIDSVNFLPSSLDYLAKGSDPNCFKMLQRRGTYRSSLAVCRNFFNSMSSTSLFNHCKPSSICCSLLSIPIFSLDISPSTMAIFQHRLPNVVSMLSTLLSFTDIS